MKTVWKFALDAHSDVTTIELPRASQVLSAGFDPKIKRMCIWALVETEEPAKVKRKFVVVGTGHPMKDFDSVKHIGMIGEAGFFFHVFEVVK